MNDQYEGGIEIGVNANSMISNISLLSRDLPEYFLKNAGVPLRGKKELSLRKNGNGFKPEP